MPPMVLRLLTGLAWSSATLLSLAASGADASVFADERLAPDQSVGFRRLGRVLEEETPSLRTSRLDFRSLRTLRQAAELGRPSRARLKLFEGAEFDWRPERTAATATGYSLSGPLAGIEGGTATLVVNGDVAVGSAWTPDGAYRIRTVGQLQVIERIEPLRATMCQGPLRARSTAPSEGRAGPDSAAAEDDGTEIDVLVAYTPQARRRAGGHRTILAEIDHEVAWTNEAYATSDVVHRVRLVGAAEVDYDESELNVDLYRLRVQNDGHMDEVHALRDRLAADAVLLWTTDGNIAYSWDWLDHYSNSSFAFATVTVDYPGSFAHELGHLLGLRHSREEGSTNRPFPYSHGYKLRGVRTKGGRHYETIMDTGGGNLPRFSNPRQRFLGVPLGAPGEEPTQRADGPADAVRSMNESRHHLANYRRGATRCRYRLSAPPTDVPAGGGSYMLRVEADADCPWTVRSADGLATVTSAASGTGDGTVAYRVPANEGWLREIALAVAGRMHVAMQSGGRPVKPVCERSTRVRELIEAELDADCADIAAAELSRVTKLDFWPDPSYGTQPPALGDFDGLSNLGYLGLHISDGGSLPVGVFDGLTSLTNLVVWGDDISLQPGSFRGLRNVTRLEIHTHGDESIPPGAFEGMPRLKEMLYYGDRPVVPGTFEGLSDLRYLELWGPLAHIPAGSLRGLSSLQELLVNRQATHKTPTTVAPGLFEDLPNLEKLMLRGLADVPVGLFAGLSKLRILRLQYNAFTSLPPRVFEGLSSLHLLFLDNNELAYATFQHELSTLPPGLFSGLSSLERLHLANVGLRELRPGAFREVGSTLFSLYLQNNDLAVLDAGTFDGLPTLWSLDLGHNQLSTLRTGAFRGLQDLSWLRLDDNRLTTLPPGLFTGVATDGRVAIRSEHFGIFELTLHGNPGAPFTLEVEPAVTSERWQRPVRVAARLAEGAPFPIVATLHAVGARLEAGSAVLAVGTALSEPFAVRPNGNKPVVVRVAGLPDLPGKEECAAYRSAGLRCQGYPNYTGIALEAGAPLVLNGMSDRRGFDEQAEIDLANVFLEFNDSAVPTFSVRSSDPSVATWELADGVLRLTPTDAGTTTVTVTATAHGRVATRAFSVTVPTEERRFMRGWRLTLLNDGEEAQ